MTTKKNYYVCLRFKGRPKLHMTLRYLKDLAPDSVAGVIEIIDNVMKGSGGIKRFTPTFRLEAWYGPQHTVRVLEPSHSQEWPGWLLLLLAYLPHGGTEYQYHPHVACQDSILTNEVIAVSLMCKKTEVTRWDL